MSRGLGDVYKRQVIEFDGFSTETSKFNGNIEYMSIYGFIE